MDVKGDCRPRQGGPHELGGVRLVGILSGSKSFGNCLHFHWRFPDALMQELLNSVSGVRRMDVERSRMKMPKMVVVILVISVDEIFVERGRMKFSDLLVSISGEIGVLFHKDFQWLWRLILCSSA